MNVGSFFSGIGMLDFGLHLAGLEHAWLCEVDPFRRGILEQRFPGVPVYPDIRGVGAATAGPVDVIAGGFPCKGVSGAGKRQGFGHPETVLWREMLRAIRELRPRYVLVENVHELLVLRPPGGDSGDLWREVLGGLSESGFDVVWDVLPAAAVGAPHLRQRVIAIATHSDRTGWEQRGGGESDPAEVAATERSGSAVADTDGEERRRDGGERGESGGRAHARGDREAAPDSGSQRRQQVPGGAPRDEAALVGAGRLGADADHEPAGVGQGGLPADRGIAVDWGDYRPAIRRWESIHGPAPEPLVRRVDDGASRRVERSRLSALGDGVQVQVGVIAGAYILERERERVAA